MSGVQMGRLVQISVNPRGGVPKNKVTQTEIHAAGVGGDRQRDRRYHGGTERAVCLFSWERILELQDEGHPIDCGTTGENLTVAGLNWDDVVPGVLLTVGEVRLEITSYTTPCKTIAGSFVDGQFKRIGQKVHPGWSRVYARVVQEGTVREGDSVSM